MPYTKVCIHLVWSTKYRQPLLTKPIRGLLFDHIRKNAYEKKIHIDRLNGHVDHVHCLIWLKPGQTLQKIVQLIKGESAHWFNLQPGFTRTKLYWQEEYFAISVSESIIPKVRAYIDNQEVHHKNKSYAIEYQEIMRKYGFQED